MTRKIAHCWAFLFVYFSYFYKLTYFLSLVILMIWIFWYIFTWFYFSDRGSVLKYWPFFILCEGNCNRAFRFLCSNHILENIFVNTYISNVCIISWMHRSILPHIFQVFTLWLPCKHLPHCCMNLEKKKFT